MSIQDVDPKEAEKLIHGDWTLVDVRSAEEYAAGHPTPACNVPFLHKSAAGMVPNEEFQEVFEANFAKDTKLILSCRSGKRSMRAAEALEQLGYTEVRNMRGGFAGDASTQGWQSEGLEISHGAGKLSYESLAKHRSEQD